MEQVAEMTLTEQMKAMAPWYHKIELPGGQFTPGAEPRHPNTFRMPDSLEGQRVLDVGAWDGYWTFNALKRGAREVLAIDDFSDPAGNPNVEEPQPHPDWSHFDFVRDQLGLDPEVCQREEMSCYQLNPAEHGRFDTVLCFGVLYHMRHPMLGLDSLFSVTNPGGEIRIESAILDDYSPYAGGLGKGYPGQQVLCEFYPSNQYGNVSTNWWVPTLQCLVFMVAAAGYDVHEAWKLTDNPAGVPDCRGYVRGRRP